MLFYLAVVFLCDRVFDMEKVPYDEFKKATRLGGQDNKLLDILDAAQRMEVGEVVKFRKDEWNLGESTTRVRFWTFGWKIGFKFEVRKDDVNYYVTRLR